MIDPRHKPIPNTKTDTCIDSILGMLMIAQVIFGRQQTPVK